jgi:formate dehydrogenase iron-sulfur subunit
MPVFVDMERCIACHACEVACKRLHGGQSNVSLQVVGEKAALPMLCRQCEKAICVLACGFGALFNEGETVAFDIKKCTGCDLCLLACPFGVVWSDKVLRKCDLCSGDPACVATCPTRALAKDYSIVIQRVRSRAARAFRRGWR